MSNDVISVNYEQLQAIGNKFCETAEKIESLSSRLDAHIESLRHGGWQGEGANAFYAEMDSLLLPSIQRLKTALFSADETSRSIMTEMLKAEEEAKELLRFAFEERGSGGKDSAGATSVWGQKELQDGGAYDKYGNKLNPNAVDVDKVLVSGILNKPEDFYNKMKGQDDNVIGIYNDTQSDNDNSWWGKVKGFGEDAWQAFNDRLDAEWNVRLDGGNPAVNTLYDTIMNDLQNGDGQITIEAHSQGGAITAAALQDVYQAYEDGLISYEQLSGIHVITHGSFGTDYPPGPSYDHYINLNDPVPMVAWGMNLISNPFDLGENLRFMGNTHIMLDPVSRHVPILGQVWAHTGGYESLPALPDIEQVVNKVLDVGDTLIDGTRDFVNRLF